MSNVLKFIMWNSVFLPGAAFLTARAYFVPCLQQSPCTATVPLCARKPRGTLCDFNIKANRLSQFLEHIFQRRKRSLDEVTAGIRLKALNSKVNGVFQPVTDFLCSPSILLCQRPRAGMRISKLAELSCDVRIRTSGYWATARQLKLAYAHKLFNSQVMNRNISSGFAHRKVMINNGHQIPCQLHIWSYSVRGSKSTLSNWILPNST